MSAKSHTCAHVQMCDYGSLSMHVHSNTQTYACAWAPAYACSCLGTYRRRKVFCIEFSVQCCTLRPKTQDEGPVYGAYETTSATVRNLCASLCCNGWTWQLVLIRTYLCVCNILCRIVSAYRTYTYLHTYAQYPSLSLYICICIYTHVCMCIYIYIYIERDRSTSLSFYVCIMYIYIYICIDVHR